MTKKYSNRYRTIDGLRGIAALSVVFYHLSGNLKLELGLLLPDFINIAFSYGYLGVPVFFVISGFVISLSIGENKITKQYFSNFILRRSIRLDPTYWVSIVIAIVLLSIKAKFMGTDYNIPSFSTIFSHMFYLQDLLEVSPLISVVYWTLCLEVQLYIFYIISVWVAQRFNNGVKSHYQLAHTVLIVSVGIISLAVDYKLIKISIPGLFISSWHYFLMGVLVSNVIRNLTYSGRTLCVWIFIEILFQSATFIKAYSTGGIITSIFIYILWKKDLLDSVFTRKGFQFLGTISYTLYLIHPDIGWKVISVAKLLLKEHMSPLVGGWIFIFGMSISIACAYALHLVIEKPTLILCNKLKKRPLSQILNIKKYLHRI
jgi:peptidoglycan/LPS O-acetylase OafA/YrhL